MFAIAVLIYGVATGYAVFLWRRGFSRDDWWCYALLATATIPHTGALLARGFSLQRCPVSNLFEATMFVSWTLLICHLVAGLWSRLRFVVAFGSPLLLALGIFGMNRHLDTPGPALDMAHGWVSLHAAVILLAYGTFGLSAAAAVMYLGQDRDLKLHKLRAVLSRLPSIERLERVIVQSVTTGLVLLTLGLASSAILVRSMDHSGVRGDPKVAWSILVWMLYLGMLVARYRFNRGARWMAWASLSSFLFVMLTFWGTNLLSPLHQQ